MLLNINATRGPTDCCSATHGLLLSEATGLWDAESIIFNRGRSVATWTFTGRVFHPLNGPLNEHPPSMIYTSSDGGYGCRSDTHLFFSLPGGANGASQATKQPLALRLRLKHGGT